MVHSKKQTNSGGKKRKGKQIEKYDGNIIEKYLHVKRNNFRIIGIQEERERKECLVEEMIGEYFPNQNIKM